MSNSTKGRNLVIFHVNIPEVSQTIYISASSSMPNMIILAQRYYKEFGNKFSFKFLKKGHNSASTRLKDKKNIFPLIFVKH